MVCTSPPVKISGRFEDEASSTHRSRTRSAHVRCGRCVPAAGGGKGKLFQFRGELLAASSTSVQVQVEGGNIARRCARCSVRARISRSRVGPDDPRSLSGTRAIPTVGTVADLKTGDWVQVKRARRARLVPRRDRSPSGRSDRRSREQAEAAEAPALPIRRHPSQGRSRVGTSPCTSLPATGAGCVRCSASRPTRCSPTTRARSSALAGQGPDRDRRVAAEGGRPHHRPDPRSVQCDVAQIPDHAGRTMSVTTSRAIRRPRTTDDSRTRASSPRPGLPVAATGVAVRGSRTPGRARAPPRIPSGTYAATSRSLGEWSASRVARSP